MLKFLKRFQVALCIVVLFFSACSSSGTDTVTTSTDENQDIAIFIEWAGHSWNDVTPLLDTSKNITIASTVTCEGGGTMQQFGSTITLDNCTETIGGVLYVSDGTYTVTQSGSLTTHSWDQDITADNTSFSTTGSISFNTEDNLIAYDFSATFTSGIYRINGVVSDNSDGTSNITFAVLLNGIQWKNGVFTNTDLDEITDSEVNASLTDDNTTCNTLVCSNDFQCQLFADSDLTDAYEPGNTACSSSCCALLTEVSECPGSSACSSDFECQLFADDDPTDVFETNNVHCGDNGCCAVAN